MLLAYKRDTGLVVWNSGTNSAYPFGPPDFVGYQMAGYDSLLFRIWDDDPRVERVFAGDVAAVRGGDLVFLPKQPSVPVDPPPEVPGTSLADVLRMVQDLQTKSQQLQEQSDLLTAALFESGLVA